MLGLYDQDGVLRCCGLDQAECLAYAELFALGEGAFSTVWSARHKQSGDSVALKELKVKELDDDTAEMLEVEVQALRRAEGAPHVVQLFQVLSAGQAIWLAMEHVPGRELFEIVDLRFISGAVAQPSSTHDVTITVKTGPARRTSWRRGACRACFECAHQLYAGM